MYTKKVQIKNIAQNKEKYFAFYFRYAGVPVDFEEIIIDPSVHSDADLDYAITSIKRNGVAIKGLLEKCILTYPYFIYDQLILNRKY